MNGGIIPVPRASGGHAPPRMSQSWYGFVPTSRATGTFTAGGNNYIYLTLAYFGRYTYDAVAFDLSTAVDGKSMVCGLYSVLPSGLPGSLLLDVNDEQFGVASGVGAQKLFYELANPFRSPSDWLWCLSHFEDDGCLLNCTKATTLALHGMPDAGDTFTVDEINSYYHIPGAVPGGHGLTFGDALPSTFTDLDVLSTWTVRKASPTCHPWWRIQ